MFTPMAVLGRAYPAFIIAFMMIALTVLLVLVLVAVVLKAISFLKGDKPRHHLFLIWSGAAVATTSILLFASIGLISWALDGNIDSYLITKIAFIAFIVGAGISFAGVMLQFVTRPRKNSGAEAPKPVGTEQTV